MQHHDLSLVICFFLWSSVDIFCLVRASLHTVAFHCCALTRVSGDVVDISSIMLHIGGLIASDKMPLFGGWYFGFSSRALSCSCSKRIFETWLKFLGSNLTCQLSSHNARSLLTGVGVHSWDAAGHAGITGNADARGAEPGRATAGGSCAHAAEHAAAGAAAAARTARWAARAVWGPARNAAQRPARDAAPRRLRPAWRGGATAAGGPAPRHDGRRPAAAPAAAGRPPPDGPWSDDRWRHGAPSGAPLLLFTKWHASLLSYPHGSGLVLEQPQLLVRSHDFLAQLLVKRACLSIVPG